MKTRERTYKILGLVNFFVKNHEDLVVSNAAQTLVRTFKEP